MPNADVNIGSAKVSITHALIGNVGDGNFRTSFMKSNISANWQAIHCHEISHKHCK